METKDRRKRSVTIETVGFLLLITLVLGVSLGYGWRMAQVKNTERAIVMALEGCYSLQTDELIVMPDKSCDSLKTGIIGLRRGTFDYTRGGK